MLYATTSRKRRRIKSKRGRSVPPLFHRVLRCWLRGVPLSELGLPPASCFRVKPNGSAFANIQKTASGIFLPSSAASTPLPEATVIAVGPGAPGKDGKVVPTSVQAGDRVLLPGWGGSSIKVGEEVSYLFPSFPAVSARACVLVPVLKRSLSSSNFPLGYQRNLIEVVSEKLDWLMTFPHLYFSDRPPRPSRIEAVHEQASSGILAVASWMGAADEPVLGG